LLRQKKLKYPYTSKTLKKYYLIEKELLIKITNDLNKIINNLTKRYFTDSIKINIKNNTITLKTKLKNRDTFEKLK